MDGFLDAVMKHAFLQNALLAGLLASVGCGLTGTYVVVKRIGYLAGGIAHAVLGGIGAACYFGGNPMAGAMIAALLSALLIGWVHLEWREREDTLIGALWAVGMATGILFLAKTPGYNADLMGYLFGNILMVSRSDVLMIAVADVVIVGIVLVFGRAFLAVTFDEEHATLRGLHVRWYYMLLLCMIAVTVVLLLQIVGLILVIALLTLPAAIAVQHAGSLGRIMMLAMGLGAVFTSGGLALSYGPDLPAGASIVILAGAVYLVSTMLSVFRSH